MRIRLLGLLLICQALGSPTVSAESVTTLDQLLEQVRTEQRDQTRHNEARERRFLQNRDRQRALLTEAIAQRDAARTRADRLRAEQQANEQQLQELENRLAERAGDLTEVFAVVRQSANEANNVIGSSLVSAQQPERGTALQAIAGPERPPTLKDIEQLWLMMLEEMTLSGKTVRFEAPVIDASGNEGTRSVVRVGVFNAISDGNFLRYLPDTARLVELARQPDLRERAHARELERAPEGLHPFPLDPSKGAILAMMVQTPDVSERIRQSGIIGVAILVLGATGLALVLYRMIALSFEGRRIRNANSPAIKRLNEIATEGGEADLERVALRLDETISVESSRLNRGLALLAILAAIAPLMGLLGTVTGMIETFQSITLFGTGDPKLMSGGISQALITTQLGLAVAIPLLLLHSLLAGYAERLVDRLDRTSAELIGQITPEWTERHD
ncbi:MAG: MotA/TolQ/ExbB proton channel family protein [Pseudomonadota bacterium]|nr:MotA/TolQ/ExbB proton channel family protein [Pseudomonadota bacterium]